MDQLNDHDYCVLRAAASRDLARRATDPYIAALHLDFATRYDAMLADLVQKAERRAARSGRLGQAAMEIILVESRDLH